MFSGSSTRLVQLTHPDEGRRAALVHKNELHLLATYRSLYAFAQAAVDAEVPLRDLLSTDLSGIVLDYGEVYRLETKWRFLACFDHPREPGRCLVSSAGPPWRYIASGASLRGHGDSLPAGASPDLAAIYLIAPDGLPRRAGITQGNRGRASSLGPELILEPELPVLKGSARVGHSQKPRSQTLLAEVPVQLALASIEPDHFESADFRRPGDVHVHFLGERVFTHGADLEAGEGERVEVEFEGLGRALINTIRFEAPAARCVAAPL